MKPCIFTGIYAELPPEDALRRLAGIGWDTVERSCEHIPVIAEDADCIARARGLQELADSLGVRIAQARLLFEAAVASSDAARRAADLAAVQREIECCAEMGIPVGVLHAGGFEVVANQAEEDALAANRIDSFTRIAAWAQAAGMRIAVENMADCFGVAHGRRRAFGAQIAELHGLVQAVGSRTLGICLDTSHASIQGLDLPATIREASDKLIALHVADNDGTNDQHRIPYNGRIDWLPVVAALKDIGHESPFGLEIPGEWGCPYPVLDAKARQALEVASWLVSQV
jgi:sugar phosphate isomerase/epimerase